MADPLSIFRNPPTRLSIKDSEYDPVLGQNVEVWLDGYQQAKVISYDCDTGTIERFVVRGFGEFVTINGEPAVETVTGDITVRWKHRP